MTDPQIGDLKLAKQRTLENIMDYPKNNDADKRNIIRYQGGKMREKISLGVDPIAELDNKNNNDSTKHWLVDYHNSQNLKYFTGNL